MKYPKGSLVEVSIREEGFEESYFTANIISFSRIYGYFVKFDTLLDDNELAPVQRYVEQKDVRPIPKQLIVREFLVGDVVDGEIGDGWWVGEVLRKLEDMYLVSFKSGTEEKYLYWSPLRVHQEYDGDSGHWIYKDIK